MTHDTVAAYTFLQVLIKEHNKPRYLFIKKMTYFSDGSAAQYKNSKMVKMHVIVLGVLLKGLLYMQVFRGQSLIKF